MEYDIRQVQFSFIYMVMPEGITACTIPSYSASIHDCFAGLGEAPYSPSLPISFLFRQHLWSPYSV